MTVAVPLAAETQTGSTTLSVIAWISLGVAFACALAMVVDIARGYRQHMAVMHAVWPVTALYWGPVALWFYIRRGRRETPRWSREHGAVPMGGDEGDEPRAWPAYARRNWWPVSKGVSHCGAGCTVGDIIGEWVVYAAGWSIPIFASPHANSLMAMYVASFVLAWTLGIGFQYFSIVPMRPELRGRAGLWMAVKADTLSIIAFEVGLFAFMALFHLVLWDPPLTTASPGYWMMMQIGMIVGFFTAWPVNLWLVRRGWKEKM